MASIFQQSRRYSVVLLLLVVSLLGPIQASEQGQPSTVKPRSAKPAHRQTSASAARPTYFTSNGSLDDHGASSYTSLHSHPKRAVSEHFQCLVRKGQQYWVEGILPALNGESRFPVPNFGPADDVLEDSGWTSVEERKPLPKYWQDAIKKTKGGLPKSDIRLIYLTQSQEFDNNYGENIRPTLARYDGYYIKENNAILITLSDGPRHKVTVDDHSVASADIPKRIPRMSQLSDLVWHMWEEYVKRDDPGSLRYYGVEGITNPDTKNLILEILRERRGTTDVPWERRLTFDLKTDEGKALLGSPNGLAVCWILIHHADKLGKRDPRVTIFNAKRTNNLNDNVSFIWDLKPPGILVGGTFGSPEKPPKSKAGTSSQQGGRQTKLA